MKYNFELVKYFFLQSSKYRIIKEATFCQKSKLKSAALFYNFYGMKNAIVLLFFYLTFSNDCFSQSKIYGFVKDNQTFQPVQFAGISINNKIVNLSDETGRFSILKDYLNRFDTISISCIGYETKVLILTDLNIVDSSIVLLEEKYIVIDEVEVYDTLSYKKYKILKKGSRKSKPSGHYYANGASSYGLYFSNKDNLKGTIETVGFYITDKGNPKSKFRIAIYEVDENKTPTRPILRKNIIVQSQSNGNMWFDIDMSQYRVKIPPNGFLAAMEWLPDNEDLFLLKTYDFTHEQETTSVYTGQVLGGTSEFKEDLTWYTGSNGKFVQMKKDPNISYVNMLNAMIRATVKKKR